MSSEKERVNLKEAIKLSSREKESDLCDIRISKSITQSNKFNKLYKITVSELSELGKEFYI